MKKDFDWKPPALVIALMLLALPLMGSFSTWLTLTVAGLAMGLIIFLIASGLTLVFGLMDVMNFGHGVFIAFGAYVATSVFAGLTDWSSADSLWRNLAPVFLAMLAAMALAALIGWAFERVLIRPVYGQHLKQILVTLGGAIIGQEAIKVVWGPTPIQIALPETLRGSLLVALGQDQAAIQKYRVLAVVIGLVVFALMVFALNRTKLGLLVRAGVQDREMVESLGYRIRRLFVLVFVLGSALAGLGGVMWGMFQQNVIPQIGDQMGTIIFIVIIIGGLGSTVGCFVGALLVGLLNNYCGYLAPIANAFSSIALMVFILLWRPQGLYPVSNR